MLSGKKPLFDLLTAKGSIRPDLLAAAFDGETGEEREWAIQVISDARPQYALMKVNERATLEALGSVIVLTRDGLASNQLEKTILADLDRA